MKRILVVDQEAATLETLQAHFEGRYEVDTARSAAAAIERYVRRRPDVVFLDVNMPGTTGLEMLKLLRQTDQRIPVIVVTANTENTIAAECIAQGAFGYVPKPFNLTYIEHMAAVAIQQAGRSSR